MAKEIIWKHRATKWQGNRSQNAWRAELWENSNGWHWIRYYDNNELYHKSRHDDWCAIGYDCCEVHDISRFT